MMTTLELLPLVWAQESLALLAPISEPLRELVRQVQPVIILLLNRKELAASVLLT